jgi:hypothetical protein
MKYLRHIGLVSSLVIGGVVGGLIVPLSSEAGTPAAGTLELTLKVGSDSTKSILITSGGTPAPGTCTAAEGTGAGGSGYTSCWNVNTSNTIWYGTAGRRYRVVRADPNVAGRFRVADSVGQDKMSLVGVKFEPEFTTAYPDTVTLILTERNVFDSNTNVANATDTSDLKPGKYSWIVRSAGEFSAPSGQDAVNDSVTFTGRGKFEGSTFVPILSPAGSAHNTADLVFSVSGPVDDPGPLNYDGNSNTSLGQEPTYPQFICIRSGDTTTCKPEIILTMTVSLVGPDSLKVTGGFETFCAQCELTDEEIKKLAERTKFLTWLNNKILKPLDHFIVQPTPRLTATIGQIDAFLAINNTPNSNCPGEVLNQTEVLIASGNDAATCIKDGCKPAIPAPLGTIVTKVAPLAGHSFGDKFDAPAGSVVEFRGVGCNPCFDLILTDPDNVGLAGTGSQTTQVPIGSNFTPLLISSSMFPTHNGPVVTPGRETKPWEVETVTCTNSFVGKLHVAPETFVAGETNITIDASNFDPVEDIPGPVHVSSLAVVGGVGDTLTCTWWVLTEDDGR